MFGRGNKKKSNGQTIGSLQTETEKTIEKTKLAKETKEMKPITTSALKGLRWLFWILIAIVFILGIYQVLVSKRPKMVEHVYRYEFDASESEKTKGFAENFVRDFLTYGGKEFKSTDYRTKMRSYVNDTVALGRVDFTEGQSKVVESSVWSIEKIDSERSNIIVRADLEITSDLDTTEEYSHTLEKMVEVPVTKEKVVYVSVPILATEEQVVVIDYPAFVAVDERLDATFETYSGESSANDVDKKQVKKMLEDFFDVYYSGTKGQIKTFFKEDPDLRGLEGDYSFEKIRSLELYEDNPYTAVVIVEIKEVELGGTFNQRFKLELEKLEDRWVIVTLKNRGM